MGLLLENSPNRVSKPRPRREEILSLTTNKSSNAEGGLGLICTCIPAINKLIGHLRDGHRKRQILPEMDC